jgi:prepilin-type processing-associated H-X9-DG protein
MMGDRRSKHWPGTYIGCPGYDTVDTHLVASLHSEGLNFGYVDGHVAYMKWNQAVDPGTKPSWTRADD